MNRHYPHPIIAREGWAVIAISTMVSIAASYFLGGWSLFFWLITLFVLQFFRDPPRMIAGAPTAILSPADGRVVTLQRTTDPYRGGPALKMSIFMGIFNVHSNRSPVDGTVEKVLYIPGRFFNAVLDKTSEHNERNILLVRRNDGASITLVQIAGLVARRIICYKRAGDTLSQGERYGLIRFGSRVDLYLPVTARASIALGDHVYAASTRLAELESS